MECKRPGSRQFVAPPRRRARGWEAGSSGGERRRTRLAGGPKPPFPSPLVYESVSRISGKIRTSIKFLWISSRSRRRSGSLADIDRGRLLAVLDEHHGCVLALVHRC